jgi:hypothetical protein
MDWSRYSLALIILLLLASCSQRDTSTPETVTPFTTVGAMARAPVGEPIAISLAHLAANPGLFEGSNLQLSGKYQPLPRLICERGAYPSPATWGIVGEDLMANATGLDQQLRQLLEEGQEITVEGRWLRYSGPVGCGKSAPVQEIYYLSVNRIVDPHPLARATSESAGLPTEPSTIVELPATPTLSVTETLPGLVETATLEPTMTVPSPTFISSPTQPGATATADPNATPSLVPSPLTTTPSGTGTAVTGTITTTPTITGTPVDGSATPGRGTASPGATVTPSDQDPNLKGHLDYEDLVMSSLQSGAVDSWTITIDSSDFLTVTVAPASSANMILSVLDASGQIIVDRQNQSPAGEVETIANLSLMEPGSYQIHIATDPAEQTNYALMVMDSRSYSFDFRGTLIPGAQRTDSLPEDNDHFWFFSASDSETINLRVTPYEDADAYVELYGPDGSRLLTLDDNDSGEAEILDNHSILATGMYGIRVGEFDFAAMSYQIILNKT